MTAEIAIMNKTAVALAADSAVTFSRGERQKIYNSVNKLFCLSKYHPVGVMIFGGAEIVGVPWEIIIKMYRAKLGKNSFMTLKEYVNDFLRFLQSPNQFFPKASQEAYVSMAVSHLYASIRNTINETVKKVMEVKKAGISEADVRKIVADAIVFHHTEWSGRSPLLGMDDAVSGLIKSQYSEIFHKRRKAIFEKIPLTPEDTENLDELSVFAFTKLAFNSTYQSGLVFAGFGENEIFPGLTQITVEGVVADKVKHFVREVDSITFTKPATIAPFAQTEMVSTFMEGVNPSYNKSVRSYLQEMFAKYPHELLKRISAIPEDEKKALLASLQEVGKEFLEAFLKRMEEYRRTEHVVPVMDAIAGLPKDELAAVAESLVNLTSFKRRFSMDAETVGGAIDVAVISKGDGFVWIKRKHYFKPELNTHFLANYFRDYNQTREKGETHGQAEPDSD